MYACVCECIIICIANFSVILRGVASCCVMVYFPFPLTWPLGYVMFVRQLKEMRSRGVTTGKMFEKEGIQLVLTFEPFDTNIDHIDSGLFILAR